MILRRTNAVLPRWPVAVSRILAAVLVTGAAGVFAGGTVRVETTTEPAGERGAGLLRDRYTITLPTAKLDYRTLRRPDDVRAPVETHKYHALGLEFGRRLGNGGWDLWKFLTVRVRSGDGTLHDGTAVFPPRGVCVLEARKRAMVELAWPLAAAVQDSELAVRLLQSPGLAEWLFLEVKVTGGSVAPEAVQLSCYPGNTSGPVTRERWLFSDGQHRSLHSGAVRLDPRAGGVLLYNRYAQERDGCLLVWLPEEVCAASASGTYGVQTTLQPASGYRALHVALGYFRDTAWPDAVTTFVGETPAQVRQLLAATSWTPELEKDGPRQDLLAMQALLQKVPLWPGVPGADTPLAGRRGRDPAATVTFGERYARLRSELEAATGSGNERTFVQTVAAAHGLRDELFAEALRLLQ